MMTNAGIDYLETFQDLDERYNSGDASLDELSNFDAKRIRLPPRGKEDGNLIFGATL